MGIMVYGSALYHVYIMMNSRNDTFVNVAVSLNDARLEMDDRPNDPSLKWLVMQQLTDTDCYYAGKLDRLND